MGIDVHLKSWTVTILTENISHRTFRQPPSAVVLVNYLKENFPGWSYYSAYEAGYSGFWAHYQLLDLGINNIVVNPSDVPTTQKEQFQKNDPVDSRKIACSFRAKQLIPIYVLSNQTLEDRSLIRTQEMLVKDLTQLKNRVKSLLHFNGIITPEEFKKPDSHWFRRFIHWLKEGNFFRSEYGMESLHFLITEIENQRNVLLLKKLFIA